MVTGPNLWSNFGGGPSPAAALLRRRQLPRPGPGASGTTSECHSRSPAGRPARPRRGDVGDAHLLAGVHAPRPDRRPVLRQHRGAVRRVASSSLRTTRARPSRARTSIPFVVSDEELPDNGWDFVIRSGLLASLRDQEPDAISAVEIAVRPDRQGAGLSSQKLAAMRDNAARQGFAEPRRRSVPTGRQTSTSRCRLTRPRARGRTAGRPVAPGARPGRWPHRKGGPALDGHPRHPRRVAGLDQI